MSEVDEVRSKVGVGTAFSGSQAINYAYNGLGDRLQETEYFLGDGLGRRAHGASEGTGQISTLSASTKCAPAARCRPYLIPFNSKTARGSFLPLTTREVAGSTTTCFWTRL